MEFEHGTAPTAEDIALADAPRMAVQPFHGDMSFESPSLDRSGRTTGSFSFEQETTVEAAKVLKDNQHPHYRIALISAVVCVALFGGLLLFAFVTR